MGSFSWMFADENNRRALKGGNPAYIPQPKGFGPTLYERYYDCYGGFSEHDIYELVADWNREWMASHPEYLIPSYAKQENGKKTISEFPWYQFYADLTLSKEQVVERWKERIQSESSSIEYRFIGIILACEDEDNAALPFPIKVCKNDCVYEEVPTASIGDPLQGCN